MSAAGVNCRPPCRTLRAEERTGGVHIDHFAHLRVVNVEEARGRPCAGSVQVPWAVRESMLPASANRLTRAAKALTRGSRRPLCRQGGTLVALGPGPIGDMAARIALHQGAMHNTAVDAVRRGGTISPRVYGDAIGPVPMQTLFDKQIQPRMGQADVRRWVAITDDDRYVVVTSGTHRNSETSHPPTARSPS